MKSFKSYFAGFLLAGFLVVVLFACEQPQNLNNSVLISKSGIKVEALFPAKSLMVFKFGTDNQVQLQNLDNLLKMLPDNAYQSLADSFNAEFNKMNQLKGLDFEKDFLPAFGNNFQVLFSLDGDFTTNQEYLMAVLVQDLSKATALFERLAEDEFEKSSYKGSTVYFKTDHFVVFYKDVLLMANRIDLIEQAIDRAESGNDSLLKDKGYQKSLAKMQNPLGFFYLNPPAFFNSIQNSYQQSSLSQQFLIENSILNAMEGEVFVLYAEPNGLRIDGLVFLGDDKKMEVDFSDYPLKEPYLYKKIKVDDPILYFEFYDLKKSIELAADFYERQGFDQAVKPLRQVIAFQGIDVDKDLMSFLDRGMAISMGAGTGLIPTVDIFIDASSNPAGAKKVMQKIFDATAIFLKQMVANDPKLNQILRHKKITENEYIFDIDYSKSLESDLGNVPPVLMQNKLVIKYGVNSDNILYSKIDSDLEETKTNFADNAQFKLVQDLNKDFNMGLIYFNSASLINYIDRFMQDYGSTDPYSDGASYIQFKKYAAVFKGMIIGYKNMGPKEGAMRFFIYMAK